VKERGGQRRDDQGFGPGIQGSVNESDVSWVWDLVFEFSYRTISLR
jgi:hypothetical protein